MRFRVLGPLEVEMGGELIGLGSTRQRQLLALLLLHGREPASTDRLAEELWSGSPPETARHTVQAYVHRLREAFGPERARLETSASGYRLRVSAGELDALRFENLAAEAREASSDDPERAAALLAEALSMWRGSLLSDLPDLASFEAERARLEELRLTVLEDRVEADLRIGRHPALVGELEALVAQHPLRERLWGQLMLALYGSGRQADALAAFGRARKVLAEELGIDPGPGLANLERQILAQHPGLAAPGRPSRPVHNLPMPRTSFVGRQRELTALNGLLRARPLVTITGPPGSGKTRLALEAARGLLEDGPEGVFFVDLAPTTDPRLVPSSIADSVGARAEGARPVLDTLRDHVRDRNWLLVLDNFEQVVEAAPVVAELLAAAPRIRILVTSRERLHVSGEQEFAVPPLRLPDAREPLGPEHLKQFEAVELFIERATAVDPGFRITEANASAVTEICFRLDGLPLAIELAASRTKLLSPEAIAHRLGRRLELLSGGPVDLPARQRTLREAVEWSHDLLDDDERALFRDLSVFAGGWTLEAVEAVADRVGQNLVGALESLVDKSLVTRTPTASGAIRFGMLETIREFAVGRLVAAGDADAMRDRHASFFLDVAEAAEPHLRKLEQKRWLDELELEHDNLRGALRHALHTENSEVALRLVGALWRFWHLRGRLSEGRRWAEEALALPRSSEPTAERARALTALGGLSYWQEDLPVFRRAYEEALAIARELGDRAAIAEGLYNLSNVYAFEGNILAAVAIIEEGRAMFESLGILRGVADCLAILAIVARIQGDQPTARTRAEESLRLERRAEDRFGATDALRVLGRIALADGDLATAEASFLEALDNDEYMGNRTGMGIVLDNLAAHAGTRGKHRRAVMLAGASQSIKEAAGGYAPPPFIDLPDPREAAREALGEAAVEEAWEKGRAMTLTEALAYARQGSQSRTETASA